MKKEPPVIELILVRPETAARMLEVSRQTIYRMFRDGVLRGVRMPRIRGIRFSVESLKAVISQYESEY